MSLLNKMRRNPMLFRKSLPRSCSYCEFATKLNDDQVLCLKKGIRPIYSSCRKFLYDPCKRIPPKPKAPDFQQYSQDDFKL